MPDSTPDLMRVAAGTSAQSLSNAINARLRDAEVVELLAIGPEAISAAVKGIAISRGPLVSRGFDVSVVPRWTEIESEETERGSVTGITLRVARVTA